ncbi:uncharacterized protein LOC122533839 [Frieseomelitta varia]|uniref:uncharacterized protein LOC122533839 n=1 Tax=Frieseomelitta varia TaxID=561572 RepID=UPI001CB696AE|nr:uncharacterized protein LOC122533839 [Frieseomelitta varia]
MNWQALETQYLGDMKFFMQLVGMWPYQERFAKLSTRLFSFLVVIYAFITEVSRVIVFYSTEVLLDQMVYLDIIIGIFTKQYHYVLNAAKLKELLREIVADRMLEYPKEELEILDSYFNKATYFCFVYKGVVILITVYVAGDLCLIYVIHHGCALLTISGYRFKHAFDEVSQSEEKDNDVLQDANAKVCRAIKGHKKAIEYVDKIDNCYVHYFLIILGLIIIAFTSTFVRLSMMEKGTTYYVFCMFTVAQLFHLFFLTSLGQFVINIHDEVYQSICGANWYNGAPKTQLLYVLVLRKCLNSPVLTGERLIPLNLFSFVQILKVSFSYYTVFNT